MTAVRSKKTAAPALPAVPPTLARAGWAWISNSAGEHALRSEADGLTTRWYVRDLARAFDDAHAIVAEEQALAAAAIPAAPPAFVPGPDAAGVYRRPPGMAERLYIAPGELVVGRWQPRKRASAEKLAELRASVRQHGVLEDVIALVNEQGELELIAGHRRTHAAAEEGLGTIPVKVLEVTAAQAYALAIISNDDREDLNELERGQAYATMQAELGLTEQALAERVGRSRAYVQQRLILAGASLELQAAYTGGSLTFTQARAICLGSATDAGPAREHEVQRAAVAEVLALLAEGERLGAEQCQALAERYRDGSTLDSLRALILAEDWGRVNGAVRGLPTRTLRGVWGDDVDRAHQASLLTDGSLARRVAEQVSDRALREALLEKHPPAPPAPPAREPWQLSVPELLAQHPGEPLPAEQIAELAAVDVAYLGSYLTWPGHASGPGLTMHVIEGRFTAGGDVGQLHKPAEKLPAIVAGRRAPVGPAPAELPAELGGWHWERTVLGWRLAAPEPWRVVEGSNWPERPQQTGEHAEPAEAIRQARTMLTMRAYGLAGARLPRELRAAIEAALPPGGALNGPVGRDGRQWVITLSDKGKQREGPHGCYDLAGLERLIGTPIAVPPLGEPAESSTTTATPATEPTEPTEPAADATAVASERVAELTRRAEMQGYHMELLSDGGAGFRHSSGRLAAAADLEAAEALILGWETEAGLPHTRPAPAAEHVTALSLAEVADLAGQIGAFLAAHGRAQGGPLGEAVNLLSVAHDALRATVGIRRAA